MIVMVNAVSIKEGGSLVVLRSLIRDMVDLDDSIHWHIAAHISLSNLEEFRHPCITGHFFSNAEGSALHVQWWYNITLPSLVRGVGADILFSLTNYLPMRRLGCPTLLLEQHAGHFSDVFDERMCAALSASGRWMWRAKKRWILRSLRVASAITVQTTSLADAIARTMRIDRRSINVIPHGSGLVAKIAPIRSRPNGRVWHIGYVSKFGVQKNFEVLFEAVRLISESGEIDIRLHLTLDPDDASSSCVLSLASQIGINNILVNHGELDENSVRDLYTSLDMFVFPSICESFGLPMLEAMAHALPMIVADVPVNREVAGPDAPVFAPDDAAALAQEIVAMTDASQYKTLSCTMRKRAQRYSWTNAARETLRLIRDTASNRMSEVVN